MPTNDTHFLNTQSLLKEATDRFVAKVMEAGGNLSTFTCTIESAGHGIRANAEYEITGGFTQLYSFYNNEFRVPGQRND